MGEEIEKIKKNTTRKNKYVDPRSGEIIESEGFPNPTKGQSDLISAIERKGSKQIFDVGIRAIYLGTDAAYNGIMVPAQLALFKPFNSESGNGLSPAAGKLSAMFNDLPWEDRSGHHKHVVSHNAVQVYRRRAFFYDPYIGNWIVMSTEELATLFHIPSSAVSTPNLPRIQSATAGAPSNLPS